MGFAVVDVNMRGTGCSGGAFNYFEPLQNLDAYDVIETIAHQPWVLAPQGRDVRHLLRRHQPAVRRPAAPAGARGDRAAVGASTRPRRPSTPVASSTPASRCRGPKTASSTPSRPVPPTASTGPTNRSRKATRPARPTRSCTARRRTCWRKSKKTRPTTRPWPTRSTRSRSFTTSTCRRSWHASGRTSRPAATAPIWPSTSPAPKRKWFTFTNGAHIDSLDPYTFDRLYDFLELFVAHQAPINNQSRSCMPWLRSSTRRRLGLPRADQVTLPPDPIQEMKTYARSAGGLHRRSRRSGCCSTTAQEPRRPATRPPATPIPGFEQSFSAFPIPGTTARSWYLGPEGTLNEAPAAVEGVDSYTSDANATPLTDYSGGTGPGGLWGNASQWEWNWAQPPAGSAVSYVSAPLSGDTTAIGGGAVNLWVKSSTPDVDLQATVSEVRPGRQRDLRPERLDPRQRAQARHHLEQHVQADRRRWSSRSRPSSHPICSRCRPANSSRSRSRCTSRGTPTAPARASGSRSLRPTARSRCGRSARPSRKAAPPTCRSPSGPACPPA